MISFMASKVLPRRLGLGIFGEIPLSLPSSCHCSFFPFFRVVCLHSYIRTGEDATAYSPSYCVRSSGLVLLLRILCFVVPLVSHLSVLTQSSPSFPSFFVYVSFGGSSVNISACRRLSSSNFLVPSFLPSLHIHTSLCFSFHSLSCTSFPGFVFFQPNETETWLSTIVCTITTYHLPTYISAFYWLLYTSSSCISYLLVRLLSANILQRVARLAAAAKMKHEPVM